MDNESDLQKHSRYFFFTCFIAIIILSIYLVRSLITAVVYAMLLTYIFYPIYKKIKIGVRSENAASILTSLIIIMIIVIPLIFAANALINESVSLFRIARTIDLTDFEVKISRFLPLNLDITDYLQDFLNNFTLSIARNTSDFLITLPRRAISFFAMLFTMFYLFKEGPFLVSKIEDHIPLKDTHKSDLARRFNNIIYASLYGIVLTAVLQGALGALGLWIFGIPSPILWGIVMVILSMLPFVGAYLIWLPAAVFKIVSGDLFNGIGLLIYGVLIVSTVDNIIRPKIVSKKGKVHPVLVLLGVIGGLQVFGLLGIIIGPLILAILMVFFDLYLLEKDQSRKHHFNPDGPDNP